MGLTKEQALQRVRFGYKAFVEASQAAPASVTAQGAYIAARCKDGRRKPSTTGDALLADKPTINGLVHTACVMHQRRAVSLPDSEVTASKMESIIQQDFNIAQKLAGLSPQQLRHIYEDLYRIHGGGTGEFDIAREVRRLHGINVRS